MAFLDVKKKRLIPAQEMGSFQLSEASVFYQNIPEILFSVIPKEKASQLEQTLSAPIKKKGYKHLLALLEGLDDFSEKWRLLTYYLIRLKNYKKAIELAKTHIQLFPNDLLAKVNLCELLLEKKKHKLIPIFLPSFDPTKLCPSREFFFLSEYRGVLSVAGRYYLATKDYQCAQKCHYICHMLDATHPTTQLLGRKLYQKIGRPNLFSYLFQWTANRLFGSSK